jgi:hypothetical protein
MSIGWILVIVLIVLLIGGVGGPYVNTTWPHGYGLGWPGNSALGVVLIILLILVLLGRI